MNELSPYFIERSWSGGDHSDHGAPGVASIDLWQSWLIVRRHIWIALVVPLLFVLLVGLRDLMATPLYTAQATILIKSNAPRIFDGSSLGVSPGADTAALSSWGDVKYKTDYKLLKARSLAARVIVTQGLATNPLFTGMTKKHAARESSANLHPVALSIDPPDPPPSPGLINVYLGDLHVAPIDGTELVAVRFTTASAKLSARLANVHVHAFIRQGIELDTQATDEAEQFLQSKLAQLKRQLEQSELALNKYRRAKGIIPGLISVNGNEDIVLGRLDKLSAQSQAAHLKTINLGTKVALINKGHANVLPSVLGNGIVQSLKGQLDTLQTQYAAMSGQYKLDYLPMAQLVAKIRATKHTLVEEIHSIAASIKQQYVASLKDEHALDRELKKEKEFALGLNDAAVKYAILRREADTNRQLYDVVLKRLKDVEVTGDLHASNVSVVDAATPPTHASSPRKARDLMAAALFGLMAGLGLTFVLDRQDDTIRGPQDIELNLGVPHLAMVPDFQRSAAALSEPKAIEWVGLPAASGKEITSSAGHYSYECEAFRTLRTSILLSQAGFPPKTILVTSALPREGKTTVSANLAITLAGTRKRVALVDADLRRPDCHKTLAIENHLGLTEVLAGVYELNELIRPATVAENLFVLSAGEIPPDPSSLLGSEKMQEVLAWLADSYDFVVIDSSPVLPVTDTLALAPMVDGVVVVADRKTAKRDIKAGLSRLQYARARVFGVLLNKADVRDFVYHSYAYEYPSGNDGDSAKAQSENHDKTKAQSGFRFKWRS